MTLKIEDFAKVLELRIELDAKGRAVKESVEGQVNDIRGFDAEDDAELKALVTSMTALSEAIVDDTNALYSELIALRKKI